MNPDVKKYLQTHLGYCDLMIQVIEKVEEKIKAKEAQTTGGDKGEVQ